MGENNSVSWANMTLSSMCFQCYTVSASQWNCNEFSIVNHVLGKWKNNYKLFTSDQNRNSHHTQCYVLTLIHGQLISVHPNHDTGTMFKTAVTAVDIAYDVRLCRRLEIFLFNLTKFSHGHFLQNIKLFKIEHKKNNLFVF